MTTDTSERGLWRLICTTLTGSACDPGPVPAADQVRGQPSTAPAGSAAGRGTTTGSTASIWASLRRSCPKRSPRWPRRWIFLRTIRPGESSWRHR